MAQQTDLAGVVVEEARQVSLARARLARERVAHQDTLTKAADEIRARLAGAGLHEEVSGIRIDTEWGTLIALRPASIMTPKYQRSLKQSRVRRMARSFDPRLYGVVLVTTRGGKPSVIDGQHRIHAAIQAGHGDDPLPALVIPTATYREEAEAFVMANARDTTVPATSGEVFHARVEQGDERAEAIVAVVEPLGLELDLAMARDHHTPGVVRAIATLERIFKQGGPEHLADVLGVIKEIWGDQPGAYTHWMLMGAHQFLWRYHDIADRQHLMKALRPFDITTLTGRAMMRRIADGGYKRVDSGASIGRTMHDLYNETPGARKLADWAEAVAIKGSHIPEGALYVARPAHTRRPT